MRNYNYSPLIRNKFWLDNTAQNPEEEGKAYSQIQHVQEQIIAQHMARESAKQEQKELQEALEKEVEKQLDKAVEKALNDIFKNFLK